MKRIDSVKDYFPESQPLSKLIAPVVEILPVAQIKNVCFVNYTESSKDYYCDRPCDTEFNANIADNMSIWLHGESGTGKTALVARNLSLANVKHLSCSLEPVTIDSCESIFRGLIEDIAEYVKINDIPKELSIKNMSNFLLNCQFDDNTVITIDEMSCSNSAIIEEFCQKIMRLVSYYQKSEPSKNIVFVISSIFHPKQHGCHPGKLMESFQFVCSTDWGGDIEKLFEIQNTALGNMICEEGKCIMLKSCKNLPRLLTLIMQRVYRGKNFSIESVTSVTERVNREYQEYE
ncbi:ATP-binding protein [Vibrio sp. SG41-7]|uniref:ATP-binding protein n=1 Tax=Vibrio sp. SG41-7 TaxID=2760973 RepID=UPI0015FF96D6|nr:ATP-binding protein [Vibrio sp. SG41-7]MBB1466728.1 ATP-binding protein [Vibrio sp. SG41-7]